MTQTWRVHLDGWLSRMTEPEFRRFVYQTTLALYLVGIWLHLPYGGGNVYTDITYVFQERICQFAPIEYSPQTLPCTLSIPYLQSFIEYPVLVSMFMYAMGQLGALVPGNLILNYYLATSLFLAIPTLLAVRELMRIVELRGASRNRVLVYFVVTPSFILMTLLNWYIIGVFLTLLALRLYLERGSRLGAGLLFGLSAASNFVTAVPLLGLVVSARTAKEGFTLAGAAIGTYALVNAPFIILNSATWQSSFHYIYGWNIEDSWMGAVLLNPYSAYRHVLPPVIFGGFVIGMLWARRRGKINDPMVYAFVAMFGYIFATYIYPPQLNLTLLPFFVLLPVSSEYLDFLAFDAFNGAITILGLSAVLLPFGIDYYHFFHPANVPSDPVFWLGVGRSLWEGKFALWNGTPASLSRVLKRPGPRAAGSGG